MKVCMDIQAALGQRAGVGRYVRELLAHLGPQAGGDELAAFFFDFKRAGLETPPPGVELRACRWLPGRVAQAAWKRLHFPPYDWFAGKADLYHFPNFIRPPLSRGRKSVVTIRTSDCGSRAMTGVIGSNCDVRDPESRAGRARAAPSAAVRRKACATSSRRRALGPHCGQPWGSLRE